jgi:hypothetical protein
MPSQNQSQRRFSKAQANAAKLNPGHPQEPFDLPVALPDPPIRRIPRQPIPPEKAKDSVYLMLSEIGSYPLPTPEQEQILAQQFRHWLKL